MKSRLVLRGLLMTAIITMALLAVSSGRVSAQCDGPCPVPVVTCPPFSEGFSTCVAPFTSTLDTWTYLFLPNNAIKIGTNVTCPFALTVDAIEITQADYAARRSTDFADTVCNPSADGVNCVFFRVHGDTAPASCHGEVDYKIFWNTPTIQGNKHDWLLLRAPCEEATGDLNLCDNTDIFSENITNFVDRKPPVGTDPVVGGSADGMSDYIVAISNRHPHGSAIPPTIP